MYKIKDTGEEFEIASDAGIHLVADHGKQLENDRWRCELCKSEFEVEADLEIHLMFAHNLVEHTGSGKHALYSDWRGRNNANNNM